MKRICVFCGSNAGHNPLYRAAAEKLGRLLADTIIPQADMATNPVQRALNALHSGNAAIAVLGVLEGNHANARHMYILGRNSGLKLSQVEHAAMRRQHFVDEPANDRGSTCLVVVDVRLVGADHCLSAPGVAEQAHQVTLGTAGHKEGGLVPGLFGRRP